MNSECRKVRALMSLYIDGALSYKLRRFVYMHLQKCKPCMEFYFELKKTMEYLRSNFKRISEKIKAGNVFDLMEYEEFKTNVSAYFDGELTGLATLKFKNYMDKMPAARKYYTETVFFNDRLKKYINAISPTLKKDFSRKIISECQRKNCVYSANLARTVITFILAFFVVAGFYFTERIVLHNRYISDKERVNIAKIKENVIKANLKNFLY